jgi:hypothetical protein
VQIYDRLQCHTADILVPLDYFIYEDAATHTDDTGPRVYCLAEQTADTWINVGQLRFKSANKKAT